MPPEASAISEELFRRVQGEFLEMPGLRLTQPQACRLWGLDRDLCMLLLARRDGRFMQLDRTQTVDRFSATTTEMVGHAR
jgi:hypothetical protein